MGSWSFLRGPVGCSAHGMELNHTQVVFRSCFAGPNLHLRQSCDIATVILRAAAMFL
jgi:hypothetical protein